MVSPLFAITEDLGNRLLRLDPDTLARLGGLHDKVLKLELTDPRLDVYVIPSEAGLRLRRDAPSQVDVVLRGPLGAFFRLAKESDPSAFVGSGLEIEGDIELGQRFQRALAGFDPDWEERLSRVTGDVIAHRIGSLARAARAWGSDVASSLRQDATEYLQDEIAVLARRREVESFLNDVDALRADADRLEARVRALESACDPRN